MGSALAMVAGTAACYNYGEPEVVIRDMSLDATWRTVNANLHELVPDWDANRPFPEHPLDWPATLVGCEIGDDSRLTGPPWSVSVETELIDLEQSELADIDRGLDALAAQGYVSGKVGSSESTEDRHVENGEGFSVHLRADEQSGTYQVVSVSPCIRFDGDDKY
ncbi:hypothetical protein V1Y59_18490 [Gordonia sp. PKS22-38]|uniref:Lipoprotein n=1 Tax=Gordonia prachuapensis TaxID=3115651 RepID=A0ABU7MXM2_9ACTN|nr:hypothetical protein [Gordonia sp. PKS22-38]